REWAQVKKELEARGEKLSLVELVPPPIPDEENFFATPLFQEVITLLDGSKEFPRIKEMDIRSLEGMKGSSTRGLKATDSKGFTNLEYWTVHNGLRSKENQGQSAASVILEAFDKKRELWEELYKAAERPGARFPLHYENVTGDPLWMSHLNAILMFSPQLRQRSVAFMEEGKPKEAARDILLIIRLSDALSNETLMMPSMIRNACLPMAISAIWEGIERHVWTTDQLQAFEDHLAKEDLPASMVLSLRGERGLFNQHTSDMIASHEWEKVKKSAKATEAAPEDDKKRDWYFSPVLMFCTENWLRGEMTYTSRKEQDIIDKLEEKPREINSQKFSFLEVRNLQDLTMQQRSHMLYYMAVGSLKASITKSAQVQAQVDMARIACALERYKMAKGEYPENLNALVPDYIEKLPNDVASAKSYRYRLNTTDKFTLWSIGFDGVDDNATPVKKAPNITEIEKGDWAWGVFTKK
ncbi:MAG: type II secretion system protein GspG, partial [Chthoniobacterales bacterium]